MDNNKNRMKERGKSNAEQRKMEPKSNASVGMVHGQKVGHYGNSKNHHEPILYDRVGNPSKEN